MTAATTTVATATAGTESFTIGMLSTFQNCQLTSIRRKFEITLIKSSVFIAFLKCSHVYMYVDCTCTNDIYLCKIRKKMVGFSFFVVVVKSTIVV